jgi:hypothetical protein
MDVPKKLFKMRKDERRRGHVGDIFSPFTVY